MTATLMADAPRSGAAALGLVRSETSSARGAPSPSDLLVAQLDHERRRFGRMRRVILTAGRLLVDSYQGRCEWAMVTLTYRPDEPWRPGDVSAFLKRVRDWMRRRGHAARYVWCLEVQPNSRLPHYHVLLQLAHGFRLPKPDEQGWWRNGLTRIELARRAVGYLAKYASKAGAQIRWRGARCYGVSGLSSSDRAVLSYWRAPRWVRSACGFADAAGTFPESQVHDPVRRVRGGWLRGDTGEILVSPVVAKFVGGVLHFFKREFSAV